jgi:hypothetical protein
VTPSRWRYYRQLGCRAEAGPHQLHTKVGRRIREGAKYNGLMTNPRNAAQEAMHWFIAQHPWPNDVMYHYTSKEALQNIVSTKRMWATDLRKMNDPRELRHGRDLIDQRIKAAVRKLRNPLKETFLRTVQRLFGTLMADRSTSFSISFSEHPDLPHQWRDYAADGQGFALGWSIDSYCPEIPLRMWVTYDRQKQRDVLDGLIDFHLTWIRDAVADGLAPDEAFSEAGLSLARYLDVVMQTFKSQKWSIESEFRYVYRYFRGYEPAGQIFKTRFAQGVEKQYIEADFCQVELRRVIIGPRTDMKAAEPWLRKLLDENGYFSTAIVPPVISVEDLDSAAIGK